MADIPLAEIVSVPCPKCDYDLRAQPAARCPECGAEFESIEAMRYASREAKRVFVRVMRWRHRLAIFTLVALVAFIFMNVWTASVGRMSDWTMLGIVLLWPLSGLFAIVLLMQVLHWRFHPLIPAAQRRELNGSIPWLCFLGLPFVLGVLILIAMLVL